MWDKILEQARKLTAEIAVIFFAAYLLWSVLHGVLAIGPALAEHRKGELESLALLRRICVAQYIAVKLPPDCSPSPPVPIAP